MPLKITGLRTDGAGLIKLIGFLESEKNTGAVAVEEHNTSYECVGLHNETFRHYTLDSASQDQITSSFSCDISESEREFSPEAYRTLMNTLVDIRR